MFANRYVWVQAASGRKVDEADVVFLLRKHPRKARRAVELVDAVKYSKKHKHVAKGGDQITNAEDLGNMMNLEEDGGEGPGIEGQAAAALEPALDAVDAYKLDTDAL